MYLFVEVTFFDDVRIKFYFSTFELRTEIALKLKKIINSQSLFEFSLKLTLTLKLWQ